MFTRNKAMSIGDWWLFWILMCIPVVNVIIFLAILLSSGANQSLKTYLAAIVIPIILVTIVLIGVTALGSSDSALVERLQILVFELLDRIQTLLP